MIVLSVSASVGYSVKSCVLVTCGNQFTAGASQRTQYCAINSRRTMDIVRMCVNDARNFSGFFLPLENDLCAAQAPIWCCRQDETTQQTSTFLFTFLHFTFCILRREQDFEFISMEMRINKSFAFYFCFVYIKTNRYGKNEETKRSGILS